SRQACCRFFAMPGICSKKSRRIRLRKPAALSLPYVGSRSRRPGDFLCLKDVPDCGGVWPEVEGWVVGTGGGSAGGRARMRLMVSISDAGVAAALLIISS